MRYIVAILLFIVFGFSLMLVIVNNQQVDVNLLFSNVPQMNLGLLIIICMVLGIISGILLAVILFRVLQMKLENQRLSKELTQTRDKLLQTQHQLEQHLAQVQHEGIPLDALKRGNPNLPPV